MPAAQSIIDPEALVLFSLELRREERRLIDFAAWLARTAPHLVSVQRVKSVARNFDASGLALFAKMATQSGDRRWSRLASEAPEDSWRPGKGSSTLNLDQLAALTLKLRAGFGPGTRADVLSFLIGFSGARATIREIAAATAYTATAVRSALQDMQAAGFVTSSRQGTAAYETDSEKWLMLLYDRQLAAPRVRDWAGLFRFVRDSIVVLARAKTDSDAILLATAVRDVYERNEHTFELNGIPAPRPGEGLGVAYLDTFGETLRGIKDWAGRNV